MLQHCLGPALRGAAEELSADLRIVHSSDIHLGADARYGADGADLHLQALRQVLQTADDVSAQIVLLVGDIFDHNRVPLPYLDCVTRVLAESGRTIVILPGNHDPLTPDSVYRRGSLAEPSNVHVLGVSGEAALFPEWDLEIWGWPHLDYGDMMPLRDPRPRTTRWQIAAAHGHVIDQAALHSRYRPFWLIHPDEITATGADYVALGHWNRAACVGDGTVPAYYSGSPDYAGTVNLVRLTAAGATQVTCEPVRITE